MSNEVIMPKMGESIVEGTIIEWKKKIGDYVKKDEILLEISTDKVDSEIPSPVEGKLIKILYKKNDVVEVGKVIAYVGNDDTNFPEQNNDKDLNIDDDTNLSSIRSENKDIKDEEIESSINHESRVDSEVNIEDFKHKSKPKKFFSPLVKKIAKEKNISQEELNNISGTGLNGRVSKKDLIRFIDTSKSDYKRNHDLPNQENIADLKNTSDGNFEEMSRVQKIVAAHMKDSLAISPHVYSNVEVDVSEIVDFVNKNKELYASKYSCRLTYTPIFIEACVEAIKKYPLINSSIIDGKILKHNNINIGIAVALDDDSLIVPVIKKTEERNFLGLIRKASELATSAKSGNLSTNDITNSTFTLTNPGIFGSVFGLAIINQPNVAILSTGAIKKKPVVKETIYGDAVFIRSVMNLTLGYDHRLINGAYGSRFLVFVKDWLESFNKKNEE